MSIYIYICTSLSVSIRLSHQEAAFAFARLIAQVDVEGDDLELDQRAAENGGGKN
jgi:hypothetical protein